MKARRQVGTALAAGVLLLANCSSVPPRSPSVVVRAAYTAANAGRYTEASGCFIALVRNTVNAMPGGAPVFTAALWDKTTRNGTIQRIEILKEEVRGEVAKVSFRLHFQDGSTEDHTAHLVKENGVWKIVIPEAE